MLSRLALLCCLCLALLAGPAAASAPRADVSTGADPDLRLAVVETADSVQLADILSGRARTGFNPVLQHGYSFVARPGQTLWMRVRADLVADGRPRYLVLPRQSIANVELHTSAAPGSVFASTGLGHQEHELRWPDALVLPMPGESVGGTATVYLAVHGRGQVNLQPELLDDAQLQQRANSARHLYLLLYASLFLVGVFALVRSWTSSEPGFRLAQAAFAVLAAALVDAYHLQLTLGGTPLSDRPILPVALWVFAIGMLLRATVQYAGIDRNSPSLARGLDLVAWVFAGLAIGVLFVPVQHLAPLQVAGMVLLGLGAFVCCVALFADPRHWRFSPILIWIGVMLAMAAIPLAYAQMMPQSTLVRRGFQLLLALLLVVYLLLPWIRHALYTRQRLKRAQVIEPSAEEKIAHAREWMMSSLEAGMQGAAEADMEWIAYRRLMAGLKPVLPQTAAAVIAMNYHDEDLLLVEPNTAEPRFKMLLTQRASLLKNLSRSLAPQQIEIDFDGPEGPLDHVMLAIIPLPVERPGWGALVIERHKDAVYSEAELDLCAEFAALATTAADEAAEVMQARHVAEVEPESGAYRPQMVEQLLGKALEVSRQKRRPMSVLRVSIDNFDKVPEAERAALSRRVADTIRDEIDFGETIARREPEEFLVLIAGRSMGEVRTLAERVATEMRRHALPGADGPLTVSVGVSQMAANERTAELVLERSAKALAKAKSYGGDQAQMVSAGTAP